jgi:hypothetical protein
MTPPAELNRAVAVGLADGPTNHAEPVATLAGPSASAQPSRYGRRVLGSPKRGKTPVSKNQVIAAIRSPSRVSTSRP